MESRHGSPNSSSGLETSAEAGQIGTDTTTLKELLGREPRDLSEAAALVLRDPTLHGKTYDLSGPDAYTFPEIAELPSTILGHEIKYVPVSPNDRRSDIDVGHPTRGRGGRQDVLDCNRLSFVEQIVSEARGMQQRVGQPRRGEVILDLGVQAPYNRAKSWLVAMLDNLTKCGSPACTAPPMMAFSSRI